MTSIFSNGASPHSVHRRPVAGAPDLGELRRVDPQPLDARQLAHLARDRAVPVHDGAEDVERESLDFGSLNGHRYFRFSWRAWRAWRFQTAVIRES
jgi:hypothetical protein